MDGIWTTCIINENMKYAEAPSVIPLDSSLDVLTKRLREVPVAAEDAGKILPVYVDEKVRASGKSVAVYKLWCLGHL